MDDLYGEISLLNQLFNEICTSKHFIQLQKMAASVLQEQ